MTAITLADLALAWQRCIHDRKELERPFVDHPLLLDLLRGRENDWFGEVASFLKAGYVPHPAYTTEVPKPGYMLRPATILTPDDELIFNALVGEIYLKIWPALKGTQGDPDIAAQLLRPRVGKKEWVKPWRSCAETFREKSVRKSRGRNKVVLLCDISAFYDNIDLGRLRSDLAGLDVSASTLELLNSCLKRWAEPRQRGIPQGYTASDLLAKVYMADIDQSLLDSDVEFLRYNDDFRVFCRNELEAKRALKLINQRVTAKSLNLQTAKTRIIDAPTANREFRGAELAIRQISKHLLPLLRFTQSDLVRLGGPGIEIKRVVADPDSKDALEHAFHELEARTASSPSEWDPKLFHYLLVRLPKVGSTAAVDFSLRQLKDRPEETERVLRYFSELGVRQEWAKAVIAFSKSKHAIYDYQLYLIARWFTEREDSSSGILKLARQWAFDKNRSPELRCASRVIVGRFGKVADLHHLMADYQTVASDLEKAEIIYAVASLEKGARNAFLRRVEKDGPWVSKAAALVRNRPR